MYRLRERKSFVFCSDFVGNGNSLSNIITFLLSYTELITLTALELALGFPEGFYLLFQASEMLPFKTLRTLDHKYIFCQGGLLLYLPGCINVEWKIRKLLLRKARNKMCPHLILIKDQFRGIKPAT